MVDGDIKTRRRIGICVIVIFLIWFLTATFMPLSCFLGVPTISSTVQADKDFQGPTSSGGQQLPNGIANFSLTFSAIGSFSVNNPIHIKVFDFRVNISDFLKYYAGLGFFGFEYPIKYDSQGLMTYGIVKLTDNHDGTYSGEADMIWMDETPVMIVGVPQGISIIRKTSLPAGSVPILTIGPVSDTLSVYLTESTSKLAWQLGSFSIIILEPALEAIFLKKRG